MEGLIFAIALVVAVLNGLFVLLVLTALRQRIRQDAARLERFSGPLLIAGGLSALVAALVHLGPGAGGRDGLLAGILLVSGGFVVAFGVFIAAKARRHGAEADNGQ